ncbi:MAG: efflux RND transporter periplasmic adaptor subunit [Anaerolineae bacterium]
MEKRKTWIVLTAVLLLLVGGGYAAYNRYFALAEEPQKPALQMATVTRGDIIITTDGSGELVPAAELVLTFHTSGVLDELPVEVGDQVREDDLLARLETDKLERAVVEADIEVQLARLELAEVREGPSEAELADARAALRDAQAELELAQDAYQRTFDSSLDDRAEYQKLLYDWYVGYYQRRKAEFEAGDISQSEHDHAMNAMISAQGRWQDAVNDALAEEAQAANRVAQAQNVVYQAWENLQLLESGPLTDTLVRAELDVDQALLAREEALADLGASQLYAPFDGVVMDIAAEVGDQVGTNTPILTLADLSEPLLRFWVEEADMSSVAPGNPVNIVFEALPDDTFTGEIVRVDPVLVTVDGTPAVQAWARLDPSAQETNLLSGMTAEVEVVAAEARNVLLVPVEALRELSPGQEPPEPGIATAQAHRGDLIVSVSGSGTLLPASEIALGFQTGGYLDEVLVEVGERVQEGEVLARLETDDLELAVAEADIKARQAQLDLADALEGPSDAELADARANLQSAQTALAVAWYTYSSTLNSDFDSAVRNRLIVLQWSVDQVSELEETDASQDDLEEAWDERALAEYRFNEGLHQAEMEELDAWNQLDQAQNGVYQAQEKLELLQSGPTTDTIMRAQLKADQAALALEDARDALEAAQLRAPFDSTVVDVTAIPGEYVGTAPIITLADLEEPVLQFWVEETDMSGVAVGDRVEIIFEALPDDTFTGEVIRIDPALVTVDGTPAVQAWASVDTVSDSAKLLGGMNAEVEVISAESKDTLLVPLQALRELGPDQYAVFVVQADGEMVLRPVEVGLMDFVNAEILSGLGPGEIVSLGEEESTETETPEEMEPPRNPMMRMFGG